MIVRSRNERGFGILESFN
ncbi:unnamed protein product, partial [Didymodactylos carnosus]